MDPIVLYVSSIQSALICEVLPELFVDISSANSPRIFTINCITETWSIHDREPQLDTPLFDVHRFLFDGRCLFDAIWIRNGRDYRKLNEDHIKCPVDNQRIAITRR